MTALLTATEAAQLRLGEQLVIVRPGDRCECARISPLSVHEQGRCMASWPEMPGEVRYAPQDWVALTGLCPTCGGSMVVGDPEQCRECGAVPCNRHRCDDCENGSVTARRDGRRIVPLYTDCPKCHPFNGDPADGGRCQTCGIKYHCYRCNHPCNMMATGHGEGKCENHDGRVMVGRGSIEVVPVSESLTDPAGLHIWWTGALYLLTNGDPQYKAITLSLDPLPVPGRDFGIVIDCVEVAP